jgi:hypothetical protein
VHPYTIARHRPEIVRNNAESAGDHTGIGRSNSTERAAENHVEHILNKPGFRSRAQIAARVMQRA